MHDIAIDKVMTSDPATVSPQSSAAEARRLLDSNVIHHLPVVEGDRLVGIVSSSDLLKLHLLDNTMALFTRATVDQIMETNVTVLGKNSTLREAVEKLSMGNFHALPVVDRKRRLLGIVTSTDLMNELMLRLGD
ncbi:MAG: CBS domain-containing protein [Gammaproteobacteria bacterium]|jgi:CBS domain-containing protein|nr:CBS domain-containing protein [Gammaproteobacteria bacterium]